MRPLFAACRALLNPAPSRPPSCSPACSEARPCLLVVAPSPLAPPPTSRLQVKGAKHKTKRALMEVIHRLKAERLRSKNVADQAQAAKSKADEKKQKKQKAAPATTSATA